MRKHTTKFLKIARVKPGEHVLQVIYIESSGKTRSPFGGQYLSDLIAQRLARSLRRRKVPGYESRCGQELFIL